MCGDRCQITSYRDVQSLVVDPNFVDHDTLGYTLKVRGLQLK